ncbi:MAG: hypothetical protein C0613_14000 [Desulfobulbaceae bacterium]|nr:MAG: hypothetical protein C0613_14000 [Desulfobulbaceae bacterium]
MHESPQGIILMTLPHMERVKRAPRQNWPGDPLAFRRKKGIVLRRATDQSLSLSKGHGALLAQFCNGDKKHWY